MALSIELALDRLLKTVKANGRTEATVNLYRVTLKSLIRECGYSLEEDCNQIVCDQLLHTAEKKFAEKRICKEYLRFTKRACRLLLESGTLETINLEADYSGLMKFVPKPEYQNLVNDIIKYCCFCKSTEIEIGTHIRRFFCFLEEKSIDLNDVNNRTMLDFIEYCSETVDGTIYRVVRSVKCISSYFKENSIGNITADFSGLSSGPRDIRLIPAFTPEEMRKTISVIDTTTNIGKRDLAIITLSAATGIRGCDIVNLKLSDIDWKNKTITFIQQKVHRQLVLPLPNSVLNNIADYILHARPHIENEYIFLTTMAPFKPLDSGFSLSFKKYCDKAGVKHIMGRGFHSVRRFFATQSSAEGISIYTISEMIGHKSISEDRVYLSFDEKMNSFVAGDFTGCPVSGQIYTSGIFGGFCK